MRGALRLRRSNEALVDICRSHLIWRAAEYSAGRILESTYVTRPPATSMTGNTQADTSTLMSSSPLIKIVTQAVTSDRQYLSFADLLTLLPSWPRYAAQIVLPAEVAGRGRQKEESSGTGQ